MNQHPASHTSSRPFLKWSGGKQRLLGELLPRLPRGKRLIEPFVGAGSIFLASDFESFVINDANPDLIAVWSAVQARPAEFIKRASSLFIESNRAANAYLRIRATFNAETDRFERAVLFPYLNRFGFNGLFRVSQTGRFNVPYGHPKSIPGFPWEQMEAAHLKLRRTTVLGGGFMPAMDMATAEDTLYCDPPYSDSTTGISFNGYTPGGFTCQDHEQLVDAGMRAVLRGATVVISNHDTEATRELYRGWHIDTFEVRRSVGASKASRGLAKELVATLPFPRSA